MAGLSQAILELRELVRAFRQWRDDPQRAEDARMGHSTMRAALIYQHASRTRDQRIADAISANVNKARQPRTKVQRKRARRDPKGHARGTNDE
jgi:hypothetical protein